MNNQMETNDHCCIGKDVVFECLANVFINYKSLLPDYGMEILNSIIYITDKYNFGDAIFFHDKYMQYMVNTLTKSPKPILGDIVIICSKPFITD